jgi:hypothetical protein
MMTREKIRAKVICAVCRLKGPPPAYLSDETMIWNIDGLPTELIFTFGLSRTIGIGPRPTLGELVAMVESLLE